MSTQWLSAVRQRFIDVITGARGHDGALGPEAQQRSLIPGTFTYSAVSVRSTDTPIEGGKLDRAFSVRVALGAGGRATNTRCSCASLVGTLTVEIGYVTGPHVTDKVAQTPGTTEDKSDAAHEAEQRARSDERNLKLALEWNELTGNDTEPVIESVAQLVEGTFETIAEGRAVLTLTFDLRLEADNTRRVDPT